MKKIEKAWAQYLTKALPGDDRTKAMLEHAFWFGAVAAYNELANGIRSGAQVGERTMKDLERELKHWHHDSNVAAVVTRAMPH